MTAYPWLIFKVSVAPDFYESEGTFSISPDNTFVNLDLSSKVSAQIIQKASFLAVILKQYPSLKAPNSSNPPVNFYNVSSNEYGFNHLISKLFLVAAISFLRAVKA
jgi:hypothetical protein